jgi:hypothetical protein
MGSEVYIAGQLEGASSQSHSGIAVGILGFVTQTQYSAPIWQREAMLSGFIAQTVSAVTPEHIGMVAGLSLRNEFV